MTEKKRAEDRARKANDDEREEEVSGVVEGALRGLSKLIPGFGELVKGLKKSKAFQERLRAADAEIERQLEKAPPLKRVEGTRRSIIPPRTTLRVSRNTLREEAAPPQREVIADIFDEGDYLKIIAELPGVDEKDIRVEVKGSHLILSAQTLRHQYYKEIELPCSLKGGPRFKYNNGVLEISLEKDRRESGYGY